MRILKSHPLLRLVNSYIIDSPQPSNLSYLWNFGSLLAFCLVIQIITGVTLAMHYNPSVLEAFNSVEHIMRDVNNGWLIRYLHSNTASAFFFLVYLHIGKGLYYGSYRAPRTLVWTIGTVIFILMVATSFLGLLNSPKWFKLKNNNNNNKTNSNNNNNTNNNNNNNSNNNNNNNNNKGLMDKLKTIYLFLVRLVCLMLLCILIIIDINLCESMDSIYNNTGQINIVVNTVDELYTNSERNINIELYTTNIELDINSTEWEPTEVDWGELYSEIVNTTVQAIGSDKPNITSKSTNVLYWDEPSGLKGLFHEIEPNKEQPNVPGQSEKSESDEQLEGVKVDNSMRSLRPYYYKPSDVGKRYASTYSKADLTIKDLKTNDLTVSQAEPFGNSENSEAVRDLLRKNLLNPVAIYENLNENSTKNKIREDTKNLSGVYLILNKVTLSCYVGSACTNKFYSRFSNHLFYFTGSKVLKAAVKKYKISNFVFMILEFFPKTVTKENNKELLDLEDFYLKYLLPDYNILTEAGNSFGYKHTEITRKKMSESFTMERRIRVGNINKGRIYTEQEIQKIREKYLNRNKPVFTEEDIANMKKASKPIIVYNLDDTVYGEYPSITEGAESLRCSVKTIYRALQTPKGLLKRRWKIKILSK
jgi:group I intron endonuclease